MKSELSLIGFGLILFGISGCGLKGPLYFPSPNQSMQKHEITSAPLLR
ncbi:hypothetical protein A35E_00012 [secondary endosymbiont of Heteropsylla cubana]|uniref:LPS-assembly lipoprotein LptM n=1 Tax=secondary endosymbiont of Heteropsylla cubana TaxID=134287 RepID=J3YSQ2_9ENTR|nr:lipoprotein [secondary endosymbiont of Heteropsylla cubana]AFP85338.1 hypothetical protein A35E_00012 [secondary endosymbiont of Heteropsylla cubana]